MCLISYEAVHDAAAQKHQITSGVWSLQVSGVISKPPVGQLWFSSGTSTVADEQIQCGKSVGLTRSRRSHHRVLACPQPRIFLSAQPSIVKGSTSPTEKGDMGHGIDLYLGRKHLNTKTVTLLNTGLFYRNDRSSSLLPRSRRDLVAASVIPANSAVS
jgi:hypothetical protein